MRTKPNFCVLLAKLSHELKRLSTSGKAKAGIVLFALNFPFGYGGLALFIAMAAVFHDKRWLIGGTCCYAASWIMLGTATLLLGTATIKCLRKSGKIKWRAWLKARRLAAGMNA